MVPCMTQNKTLLGSSAAAQRLTEAGLEVSEETVREWARRGLLRAVRTPSGRFKFRREDLDAILEDGQPSAAAS